MLGPLLGSLSEVLQPQYLVPLAIGTLAGLIGGALPGVTITMTVIIALPFTFGLDPLQGLAAMIGVYVGGESGGLVTASLLGIPGTPSAVATTFDGFPMARRGEPGRAVWLGTWASLFGGILGALFLVAATRPLAQFALQFGPWEYFSLFVFALSMVAGVTGRSLVKGLLAGAIGLIITVIGQDPIMSVPRFTFGSEFLRSGFQFLPVLIGVFAFAQIMSDLERPARDRRPGPVPTPRLAVSHLAVIWDILRRPFLLVWSTVVGLLIGVLPAIGGSAANVMAYDQARKFSRHPEKFGTGIPEGIIASEAANNANVAGSLVTIMAFGIPGDAVTAVMLGAMIIHGIQPGPLFMTTEPRVAYGIFAAYLLAHPVMLVLQWVLARVYLRVVQVPRSVLIPIILVLCVIGAYALNNIMENVYALLLFGLLGYGLVKFGFPLAPLILGVILGDQIEINLVRSLMTDADPWLFVTRPISGLMLGLAVLSVALALWQHRRQARREAAEEAAGEF
ncbi:MAG TPA: tripartite tricarboxylate transporter permease [Candidatus Binatia bacterium]|nr:tripartite tricarboxylate transporter permease [Candidatus Binatia bacterium]